VVATNLLALFNNYSKIDHQWSNKLFIELFVTKFLRSIHAILRTINVYLKQGFLNWGAQKICKGGANDLVVVFVMRTYKEIKICR